MMNERTQKTSCRVRCHQFQITEIATTKILTYGRVEHWANRVNVCPKEEQLSNLLHDLFKDELVITYKCRL